MEFNTVDVLMKPAELNILRLYMTISHNEQSCEQISRATDEQGALVPQQNAS